MVSTFAHTISGNVLHAHTSACNILGSQGADGAEMPEGVHEELAIDFLSSSPIVNDTFNEGLLDGQTRDGESTNPLQSVNSKKARGKNMAYIIRRLSQGTAGKISTSETLAAAGLIINADDEAPSSPITWHPKIAVEKVRGTRSKPT